LTIGDLSSATSPASAPSCTMRALLSCWILQSIPTDIQRRQKGHMDAAKNVEGRAQHSN